MKTSQIPNMKNVNISATKSSGLRVIVAPVTMRRRLVLQNKRNRFLGEAAHTTVRMHGLVAP